MLGRSDAVDRPVAELPLALGVDKVGVGLGGGA